MWFCTCFIRDLWFCRDFAQVLHGAGVICCGMLIRWCVTQPASSGDPFPRLRATVQWLFTSMTSSTLEQHHHNSLTTSYARLRALWSREQRDKSTQRVNIKKASSITLSESILNWFCWLTIPRISSCCSEDDLSLTSFLSPSAKNMWHSISTSTT